MKSGAGAGAIAGLIGGIVGVISGFIGSIIGLYEMPTGDIITISATMIVLTIVFGAIFGEIFAKFARTSGLNFGLLIWFVKDIAAGVYIGLIDKLVSIAIALIFTGFFMWIVYGYVLGVLYKK